MRVALTRDRLLRWFHTPTVGRLRLSKEWRGEPTQFLPAWERPGVCRTAFEMLPQFDYDAWQRYKQLLAQPDPEEMPGRKSVVRFEGAPDRFRIWCGRRLKAIRLRELAQFGLEEMEEPINGMKR